MNDDFPGISQTGDDHIGTIPTGGEYVRLGDDTPPARPCTVCGQATPWPYGLMLDTRAGATASRRILELRKAATADECGWCALRFAR